MMDRQRNWCPPPLFCGYLSNRIRLSILALLSVSSVLCVMYSTRAAAPYVLPPTIPPATYKMLGNLSRDDFIPLVTGWKTLPVEEEVKRLQRYIAYRDSARKATSGGGEDTSQQRVQPVSYVKELKSWTPNHNNTDKLCDGTDRRLRGRVAVRDFGITPLALIELGMTLQDGGLYKPPHCKSATKVAIIMPYRDREYQMATAMFHLHSFLQRQLIEYQIFVVEQTDKELFNRALLFNAGYVSALNTAPFDCIIFTDVDLMPLDDRLIYDCEGSPKHMSSYVDKLHEFYIKENVYVTWIFGGVIALTSDQFRSTNGFSNMFFGWGGEDDDLFSRVQQKYKVRRYAEHAHFHALDHQYHSWATDNPKRWRLLENVGGRIPYDGLNCLQDVLAPEVPRIERRPLFTLVKVSLNQTHVEKVTMSKNCRSKKFSPKKWGNSLA